MAETREMDKVWNPQGTEKRLYDWWEARGDFKPTDDPSAKPFVISMPPPNITGALHIGHAITAAIEDIMIRWHRMLGDATLWVPGSDHAGIATQTVVERALIKEGTSRKEIGPRGVRQARLGVAAAVRQPHHRAAPAARRVLRLGPRALHAG